MSRDQDKVDQILRIVSDKTRSEKVRFPLRGMSQIKFNCDSPFLIKRLIPKSGLVVVWGPPKCGKSFWVYDLSMHVALGRDYRGRRVKHGGVVYCAFEGMGGFAARIEAFRRQNADCNQADFNLVTANMDLVKDHKDLIASIRLQSADPAMVVLDTLNRSLAGSESKDEDMGAYVKAADAIREAFNCAVVVVHHCGVDGNRPRGHTSLTGAADTQIAVRRDAASNIIATVEWLKDGSGEGDIIASRLESVVLGLDEDGDEITSCVIEPVDQPLPDKPTGPKLTKNQQTMLAILHAAGKNGLTLEDWNDRCKEAGIGVSRRADLTDGRLALQSKRLAVKQADERWYTMEAASAPIL